MASRRFSASCYLIVIVSLCIVPLLSVRGFFIDLESLGISTKGDEASESSDSKLLVAAPSETQEYVEIEGKTDPSKSVRLSKLHINHNVNYMRSGLRQMVI
jgi:hypothetical protein